MNTTSNLPYSELFPIIHPLERPAQKTYEQIPELFYWELANNYDFHLPHGYMTPEKLKQAVVQLKRLKVVQTNDISVLVRKYDITYFAKQRKINLDDKKRCAIFWIMNAAAFLLLNRFLETHDSHIESCALKCFNIAHDYKFAWNEREGRRKGGDARSKKIESDKAWLFSKWNNFTSFSKKAPKRAVEQLLMFKEVRDKKMDKKYTINTLTRWCREWKKEWKISQNNKK